MPSFNPNVPLKRYSFHNVKPWQSRASLEGKASPIEASSLRGGSSPGTGQSVQGTASRVNPSPASSFGRTPPNAPKFAPPPIASPSAVGTVGAVAKAALIVGSLAVAIYGVIEGLFTRSAGRGTAVSELGFDPVAANSLDPSLLYPPSTQEVEPPLPPPFSGGQEVGVKYYVTGKYQASNTRSSSCGQSRDWFASYGVWGRILGIQFHAPYADSPDYLLAVIATDQGYGTQYTTLYSSSGTPVFADPPCSDKGRTSTSHALSSGLSITETRRWDGLPDNGGDPPSEREALRSEPPPPINYRPPIPLERIETTTGRPEKHIDRRSTKTPNSVRPSIPKPIPASVPDKVKDLTPGGRDGNANNSAPDRIDTSQVNRKNNLDNQRPSPSPSKQKDNIRKAKQTGGGKTTHHPSPSPPKDKQGIPIQIEDGSKTGKQIIDDNPQPEALKQTPVPDPSDSTAKITSDDLAKFAAIALTTQQLDQIKGAAEEAICNSADGGCLKNKVKDPLEQGQGNIFDALNALGEGFSLDALGEINAKLGDKIEPGGLSGFLKKAWSSTLVDKSLNLINTALLVHNAAHLSQNIAYTVGEVISNALSTIGIKDAEGDAIDVNGAIGTTVTNLVKSILGTDNYERLSIGWAKSSRIYQTGVNVLSNVREIVDLTQDIAETTGENVALIGNALRKAGTVRENAYGWMNPDTNTESRWLNRLDKIQDTADIFEDITDNTRDLSEEYQELKENSDLFKKQLAEKREKGTEEDKRTKSIAIDFPEGAEEDERRFIGENEPTN